jgi:hypothetical protein
VQKRPPVYSALCLVLSVGAACSPAVPGNPARTATPRGGHTDAAPPAVTAQASAAASATTTGLPPKEPAVTGTLTPAVPISNFCLDTRPPAAVGRLKTALLTRDGLLLASLVDPIHGMDAQLLRNGTVVNYDQAHAKYLFESDYSVNWGPAPGSGLQVRGPFRELFVPALLDVLTRDYSLSCNELQVGGASYTPIWPYPAIDFYSVYFPGTQANGGLDWRTWVVGMRTGDDQVYLDAITQFRWEP